MTHSGVKPGARVLAVACGPLDKRRTILVGIVGRSNTTIEGVLSSKVTVDGTDATSSMITMLLRSRFKDQVRVVALNGIAVAGLNVVDVDKLEAGLGVKVLIMAKSRPRTPKLALALKAFSKKSGADVSGRLAILKNAHGNTVFNDGMYVQSRCVAGEIAAVLGSSRELLRIAHIIASGLSSGESSGRM